MHIYCLLYTSDAADERSSVDLGGRRIIKKKKTQEAEDGTKIIRMRLEYILQNKHRTKKDEINKTTNKTD